MRKKLQSYFFTGILVLLPIVISFYTLWLIFNFFDNLIISHLPVIRNTLLGEWIIWAQNVHGVGFVLTLTVVLLTGLLARNYLGKQLISLSDRVLSHIPVVRSVYVTVKQILDTLLQQDNKAFQQVVMLEYPRKGLYALAFLTGVSQGEIQEKSREEVVNVFLPTTPNPTSGFLLLVPKKDIIPLEMSVEDGIKLIISGGVISPETQKRVAE